MPANEIFGMIGQALQVMVIGVIGVFAVLAVFYVALKLLMAKTNREE